MDLELVIENDKLALMNEENWTESDMMHEEKNAEIITLPDKVKSLIENLIIEQYSHKEYQNNCFEELINIWLGESFLANSSTLNIKKETERFENDCKAHILKTIAKYLPDEENELYLAYNSLQNTGNYTVDSNGECTIYDKDKIDVRQLSGYIKGLRKKIIRQYNNLKNNFEVYLTEKLEDAEFYKLNNDPVLFQLRRSARNTKKMDYKPMLQWNKTKTKKTIIHFLKTNTSSNTASKKGKVNPFNDLYLQYVFDCLLYIT
jgi:hypothetical protein